MATASIVLEIGGVPQGLPLEDAPLAVQHDLDNSGGWSGVASVQWKLFVPPGSSAVLTQPGLLVAPPYSNDFAPDVPGGYLVHLKISNTDGSTSTHRVVIAVKDPASGVAPVAPYELGSDPDDPSPNPTRDATYGWAHVDAEQKSMAALGALAGDDIVMVRNITGVPIAAGKVCKVAAVEVYKGRVADGVAPALAKRRYVFLPIIVDGTSFNDMRPGHTLVMAKETIADGEYGLALLRGFVQHDTSGDAAGDMWCVDATGSFVGLSASYICRPVARVVWSALDTADPPGMFFFDGRPNLDQGPTAVPTGRMTFTQDAGVPVWDANYNADIAGMTTPPNPPVSHGSMKITSAANNDIGRMIMEYMTVKALSQLTDHSKAITVWADVSDVSETQLNIQIIEQGGQVLRDAVLPGFPAVDNVPEETDIALGWLNFGANFDLPPGHLLLLSLTVTFSAIAGAGKTAILRTPIIGNAGIA